MATTNRGLRICVVAGERHIAVENIFVDDELADVADHAAYHDVSLTGKLQRSAVVVNAAGNLERIVVRRTGDEAGLDGRETDGAGCGLNAPCEDGGVAGQLINAVHGEL